MTDPEGGQAANDENGAVIFKEGDQSSSSIECTDEILSPVEDVSGTAADEFDAEGHGQEDFEEEFQVLDECVEDDEAELCGGSRSDASKNVENAKSEPKSSTAVKAEERTKRRSRNGDDNETPAKKQRSEPTSKRSKSPAKGHSTKREETGRRSNRSGHSRSRSRRRRSRSQSKHNRRRSRTRSPRRPPRRKTPEKKTSQSSSAARKEEEKKKAVPAKGTDRKKDEVAKAAEKKHDGPSVKDLKKADDKTSKGGPLKKDGEKAKAIGQAMGLSAPKNESKKDHKAPSPPKEPMKGDVAEAASALQREMSSGTSATSKTEDRPVEEPKEENQSDQHTLPAPEEILTSFEEDMAANESKVSASGSESRMTSSAYDGDILEIAVPDDASLEEMDPVTSLLKAAPVKATKPAITEKSEPFPAGSMDNNQQQHASAKESSATTNGGAKGAKPAPVEGKKPRTSENVAKQKEVSVKGTPSGHLPGKTSKSSSSHSANQKPAATRRPSEKDGQTTKESRHSSPKAKPSSSGKDGKQGSSASGKSSSTSEKKAKLEKEAAAKIPNAQPAAVVKTDGGAEQKAEHMLLSQSPLPARRKELMPEVKAYVDSIRSLEFDAKVYCCFYCVACPLLLPTTPRYEEHLNTSDHKKNVVRWRICQDLLAEELKPRANRQLDVDNFAETIIGADQVIEVCDSSGTPCNFVCVMCSSFHSDVDVLLSHLTSFLHIENYMERQSSDLFSPPDVSVSEFESTTIAKRQGDPEHVAKVFSAARAHMMSQGRGCMSSYIGDKYHDMNCSVVTEMEEMEETVMMSLMEQLFAGDGSYKIKWDRVYVSKSIGNSTYEKQSKDTQEKIVGLQTIVEIWFPNRRMPPVYYCAVCSYMVTDIIAHCITNKHWIEYLNKCYKPILECLLLEADDANSMKDSLLTAVKLVLDMEGACGRIQNVIQLLADPGVIFCAVNAQIAKQIVDEIGLKMTVPKPESLKKPVTVKTEPAPVKPSAKPNSSSAAKKDVGKSANVSKRFPSKSMAATLAKKTGTRPDQRNRASVAKGVVRSAPTKAVGRDQSDKKAGATSIHAMGKQRAAAARSAAAARAAQQRWSHEDGRKSDRSASYRRKLRRSSSRSPQGARSREDDRRKEAPKFKQSTLPRRSAGDFQTRSVSSVKPRAPLLKPPTRRMPSVDRRRKRPLTPEPRGRPRTPSPPRRHASGHRQEGHHHRQDPQDLFGHGPNLRGRGGGVNSDDLHRLTEVLRIHVGLDYGRELTEEDLDGLRTALSPGTLDDLLELLRRAPSMSFHNFFAERRAMNLMPPARLDETNWATADGNGGLFSGDIGIDYLPLANRADEGERSNRRSNFDGHSYQSHRRRRSSNDDYSQHAGHGRRQYDMGKDHSSDGRTSMTTRRAPSQCTPPGIDSRSQMFPLRTPMGPSFGGSAPVSAFDVVQTYENPSSTGAAVGSGGVVYAQPLASAFSEQPFVAQQPPPSIVGGVYGLGHAQDPNSVAYGIPVQSADNGSVFLPMAPQATNVTTDFWYQQSQQPHHRRGNTQDGVRKW